MLWLHGSELSDAEREFSEICHKAKKLYANAEPAMVDVGAFVQTDSGPDALRQLKRIAHTSDVKMAGRTVIVISCLHSVKFLQEASALCDEAEFAAMTVVFDRNDLEVHQQANSQGMLNT